VVRISTGAVSFQPGGKNPAMGKGKRPEKIPVWWEISLRVGGKTSSGA